MFRPQSPGRARLRCVCALTLASTLFATGCSMSRLRPQLAELGRFAQFGGRVVGVEAETRVIAVLIAGTGASASIANYAFAHRDGRYLLLGRSGALRVLGFADRDADAVLDADEPVGWVTVPEVVEGGAMTRLELGDLRLSPTAERPGFAVDLSVIGAAGQQARARRLGEVVSLDDPRFAPEVVSRGVWEPLRFAEESGLQILFTEPYDPARTPVVFVHGMQGSPRDFRELVAGLDRTRFQAWVYYYPTGIDLVVNGLVLRELLGELRHRLGFERLHVVAHSMGGLVSLSAILGAAAEGADLGIDRFVTISTPWQGAVGTRGMRAGLAITPTTAPSWTDMLPESGFLEQLEAQAVPPGVHFSLIFGFAGSNAMVSGADDGTVAVRSMAAWSMIQQAEYVLPVAADHEGILRDAAVAAAVARLLRGEPPTDGAARR